MHNAGVYNGILAGGLLWAALTGESANDVARVLLAGAAVAGLFGTVTMKSVPTAVQAVVGVTGFSFSSHGLGHRHREIQGRRRPIPRILAVRGEVAEWLKAALC